MTVLVAATLLCCSTLGHKAENEAEQRKVNENVSFNEAQLKAR